MFLTWYNQCQICYTTVKTDNTFWCVECNNHKCQRIATTAWQNAQSIFYHCGLRNERTLSANDRRHYIRNRLSYTVYPKKYAHGFCFAVLCCGYTLTDFSISIRLTSLALWQSNDCPSASKATLVNMDKYFIWIHYERLRNHNKAKHNKTVCIFLGIYCRLRPSSLEL